MSNETVQQFEAMLYDIANGISYQQADDLVQEAWARILSHVEDFDESIAGESTWLCVLARAAMLDYVRGEQRAPGAGSSDDPFPEHALDEADPYTVIVNEEFVNNIVDWVDSQEPDKQAILHARFIDGYSFPIIGAMFGKSADTVRKMCNRAEAELRALKEKV